MVLSLIKRAWIRLEIRHTIEALYDHDIVRCSPKYVIYSALKLRRLEQELQPMADPLRGLYTQKRYFRAEYLKAQRRLAHLGGEVKPGEHDYEAFIYEAPGIRLIFYPHKVKSTGNYHIRIRPGGKCDPKKVAEAIFALAENTCTFQFPSDVKLHRAAVTHALKIGRGIE